MGAAVIDTNIYSITSMVSSSDLSPCLVQLKQFPHRRSRPSTNVMAAQSNHLRRTYGELEMSNDWSPFANVTGHRSTTFRSPIRLVRRPGLRGVCWSQGGRYQKIFQSKSTLSRSPASVSDERRTSQQKERGQSDCRSCFYGTNMTKWLCRISLQTDRAQGPFTTTFYNEKDPNPQMGVCDRYGWWNLIR